MDTKAVAIVGDRDLPQLIAAAVHLAERISDMPAVILTDTAHLPSMDRPDAFNAALDRFLTSM